MADLVAKYNVIALRELRDGEAVVAAFRSRARAQIIYGGDHRADRSSPRPAISPQAQSGWPTSGHSDRGNFIGLTRARVLVTELPSIARRMYHVNEVPLAWIDGAELGPAADGITVVSIFLSNGSTVRLRAATSDQPERLVSALHGRAKRPVADADAD